MAFFMVSDRPLGGYGIGGFQAALPAYYDRYGPLVQRSGHSLLNHPLHMLVDLGILGMTASIWIFVAFLWPALRALLMATRSGRPSDDNLTTLGLLSGIGAALLLSIWTGEWLYDPVISIPAFMLLAMLASNPAPPEGRPRTVAAWGIVAFPLGHAVLFAIGM